MAYEARAIDNGEKRLHFRNKGPNPGALCVMNHLCWGTKKLLAMLYTIEAGKYVLHTLQTLNNH